MDRSSLLLKTLLTLSTFNHCLQIVAQNNAEYHCDCENDLCTGLCQEKDVDQESTSVELETRTILDDPPVETIKFDLLEKPQYPSQGLTSCAPGTYAQGIQILSFSGDCRQIDCRHKALIGIVAFKLICDKFLTPKNIRDGKNVITTKFDGTAVEHETYPNEFTNINDISAYCKQGAFNGFKIQHVRKLLTDGIVNVKMLCSNGQEITANEVIPIGKYDEEVKCGLQRAICKLGANRLHAHRGWTMSGLIVGCCRIPHPADLCTPSDKWVKVAECKNQDSCTYTYSVGAWVNTTGAGEDSEFWEVYQGAGFALDAEALAINFQNSLGRSSITGAAWDLETAKAFYDVDDGEWTIEDSQGENITVMQVQGTCGVFEVKLPVFKVVVD